MVHDCIGCYVEHWGCALQKQETLTEGKAKSAVLVHVNRKIIFGDVTETYGGNFVNLAIAEQPSIGAYSHPRHRQTVRISRRSKFAGLKNRDKKVEPFFV